MNKSLYRSFICGAVFVAITGTLLHFVYGWTDSNPIAGLFSPVSESTWEHMKLLFFPMLICSLFISYRQHAAYPCVLSGLLAGTVIGCFLIPIIFYTYTGILSFHLLLLDIATFLVSVIAAFMIAYRLTKNCRVQPYRNAVIMITLTLTLAFFLFTFFPPDIGLFISPV